MKRRSILASLLGLGVTPTVAARVLAEPEMLLAFPIYYGHHELEALMRAARDEVIRAVAVREDFLMLDHPRCRCATLPPEEGA